MNLFLSLPPSASLLNDEVKLIALLARLKGRISRLSELTTTLSFIWQRPNDTASFFSACPSKNELIAALSSTADQLSRHESTSEKELKKLLSGMAKSTAIPKALFMKCLRVCLTGHEVRFT